MNRMNRTTWIITFATLFAVSGWYGYKAFIGALGAWKSGGFKDRDGFLVRRDKDAGAFSRGLALRMAAALSLMLVASVSLAMLIQIIMPGSP
jgi:hypothetical protein